MPRFYKHSVMETRKADSFRRKLAELDHENGTNQWFAENQILRLLDVCANGLPDCHKNFDDFMFDLWMNFSWNKEETLEQIKIIQVDPRYKLICDEIFIDWNYDLDQKFVAAFDYEMK